MSKSVKEVPFPKEKLHSLLKHLIEQGLTMFWSYRDDIVYLVIDMYDYIEEIEFRHAEDDSLLVKIDSINNIQSHEIKNILSQMLGEDYCKSEKQIKTEIDYYLMELHDYIKAENDEMVHKTKKRLNELSKYV